MAYPQGFMTPELFTKTIEQLPNETVIVPFFRGESLIHPNFTSFMKELSRFKQVQLASNGDKLSEPNQAAILSACTFFSVSLHKFTMPWKFKHLKFMRIATAKGLETQVSILESLVPTKRKNKFIQHWKHHVKRVRIYKEHSITGFGDMQDMERPTDPCEKPFNETVVYWNGKVGLCNHDWNNKTFIGNLNFNNLPEVWQSYNYQRIREAHKSGNRGKVPSCVDCCFGDKVYGELYCARKEKET
jgi:radical SAM protein with 4Fe4S-binding SPASM domain